MGPRKNDAGDRKLQQLLMTLVLRTKGMQLKSVPKMSSIEDLLKRDDEEREKTVKTLQEAFREEQKKHQQELEEMKKKLNAFQTDLAKEDVRFLERQNDLIERQKQEKDSIRQMFEDQLQQKKREFDDLQEDYSNATGELQSEKRRKMELESELNTIREGHKNEMIRMKQENDHYVQKLVKSMNTVSQVRLHSKNNSELTKALQAIKEQIETDSKLDNCIVCLTSRKDCVFQPCRDNVTCLRCAENLTNCPKCLQIIREKRPRQ